MNPIVITDAEPQQPRRAPFDYRRQLNEQELAQKKHRQAIGGMWEELGQLQFDFLCRQGLRPEHRLLDVGCGSLRGGVHFVRYLNPGNYYGVDRNASLLKAGAEIELAEAGAAERGAHLLVDEWFAFERFGATFHFALAQSVFTHLPVNDIARCLVNIRRVLEPGGRFFATYFAGPRHGWSEKQALPCGITTYGDSDPFHYHISLLQYLVEGLGLEVRDLGDWGHPRQQQMLEFTRVAA